MYRPPNYMRKKKKRSHGDELRICHHNFNACLVLPICSCLVCEHMASDIFVCHVPVTHFVSVCNVLSVSHQSWPRVTDLFAPPVLPHYLHCFLPFLFSFCSLSCARSSSMFLSVEAQSVCCPIGDVWFKLWVCVCGF